MKYLSILTLGRNFLFKSIFVLVVAILFARMILPLALEAKGHVVAYQDLPQQYLFLVFPARDCENLRDSDKACPRRAILVAKEEIDSGVVQFQDNGNVERKINMSALDFLPAASGATLLSEWKKTLKSSGYADGDWEQDLTTSGQHRIRLTLHDSQNARRDQFVYVVKDRKVVEAKTMAVVGVFELLMLLIPTLLALFIGWAVFSKWRANSIGRREKSET